MLGNQYWNQLNYTIVESTAEKQTQNCILKWELSSSKKTEVTKIGLDFRLLILHTLKILSFVLKFMKFLFQIMAEVRRFLVAVFKYLLQYSFGERRVFRSQWMKSKLKINVIKYFITFTLVFHY